MTATPKQTVRLAIGRDVTFDDPSPGPGPAVFSLSIRKCGSSVFNSMMIELARSNGCPYVAVAESFFQQNVLTRDWQNDPALAAILRRGVLYGGFRNAPRSLFGTPLFIESPKVLLVRDPRDALVSDYFSTAYAHHIPEPFGDADDSHQLLRRKRLEAASSSIDTWVVHEASDFNDAMVAYAPIVHWPTTLVLRYEDVIFDKAAMLRAIAAHVGWDLDDEFVRHVLGWADQRPDAEDPQAFVRQVTPGDHRRKLRRSTIVRINRLLRPTMKLFGYRQWRRRSSAADDGSFRG